MYSIYNVVFLSNKKKSSIDTCNMCINLKINMLSEKSQIERVHILWFYLYKTLENVNLSLVIADKWLSVIKSSGKGEVKVMDYKRAWGNLGMTDMFINLIVVTVLWEYTYTKAYQNVFFKYLQFIICWFSLNKTIFLSIWWNFVLYLNMLFKALGCGDSCHIVNVQWIEALITFLRRLTWKKKKSQEMWLFLKTSPI